MSADTLIARMRRAREQQVAIGAHAITVRIPNAGEMEALSEDLDGRRLTARRIAEACAVGWDLREIDLIPGGGPDPAPFSSDLFREWLNDNGDAVQPLAAAVIQAWEARRANLEDSAKN